MMNITAALSDKHEYLFICCVCLQFSIVYIIDVYVSFCIIKRFFVWKVKQINDRKLSEVNVSDFVNIDRKMQTLYSFKIICDI